MCCRLIFFSDEHLHCQVDIYCLCSYHIQLSNSDDVGSLFPSFPVALNAS